MFLDADPLVKLVMGLLLLASVASWTILVVKSVQIAAAKRQLRADILLLDRPASVQAIQNLRYDASIAMIQMVQGELRHAGDLCRPGAMEGARERVAARMFVIEADAVQSILAGVNILASIGAIAPFVGLAGTVWGIMNSFIGISEAHATNLAIVAPGIAEALLATAVGLFTAIPAVLIYNFLARSIAGYRRLIAQAAVLAACAFSRDLVGDASATSLLVAA
jgi:biopolymer transport protein ExbB